MQGLVQFRRLFVIASLLLSVIPTGHASVRHYTRDDVLDPTYLHGNLTWDEAGGHLEWAEPPSTPELGGAGRPGPDGILVDEFSTILAAPMYINASRLIQLDLLTTQESSDGSRAPCADRLIVVDLLAGDEFMGGYSYTENPHTSGLTTPLPAAPPGFALYRYRLPTEVVHVKAGTNLTLRLTQPADDFYCRFGVSLEEPSTLRIPVFSPEEAAYRMPDIIPRTRAALSSAPKAMDVLAGLGAVALGPWLLSSRKQRTALVFLAFAATAFGGCLEPDRSASSANTEPRDDEAGRALVETREAGDSGLANETAGAILGQVGDPYGWPIQGAHVALLGTDQYSRTSRDGLFSFRDLAPGGYVVRVDAANYASLEIRVSVVRNKVTTVDVALAYDSSASANERPHRHDYWNGANETILFEGPLHGCPAGTAGCTSYEEFYIAPEGSADHRIVRPGTSEVEVTLEFDPAKNCRETIGFAIQDNTDAQPLNWTKFQPRESGKPFHIKTTWEMTDVGHQLFSTWTFAIHSFGAKPHAPCESQSSGCLGICLSAAPPAVIVPKATIVLKRGSIPLEPPHPDHWHGTTERQLAQGMKWRENTYYADSPPGADLALDLALDSTCFEREGPRVFNNPKPYLAWPVLGGPLDVVPADAGAVRVYVNQSRANGPPGTGIETWSWRLLYKTGETQPQPYRGDATIYKEAPVGTKSADGLAWVWEVPLASGEGDGIYNKKTAWRLVLAPSDSEARCRDAYTSPNVLSGTWDMVAIRDPGD